MHACCWLQSVPAGVPVCKLLFKKMKWVQTMTQQQLLTEVRPCSLLQLPHCTKFQRHAGRYNCKLDMGGADRPQQHPLSKPLNTHVCPCLGQPEPHSIYSASHSVYAHPCFMPTFTHYAAAGRYSCKLSLGWADRPQQHLLSQPR